MGIFRSGTRTSERVARGLGWFSLAIGATEVLVPSRLASLAGAPSAVSSETLRWFGLREIATGIGVLSRPRAAGWMWARVAGDALDLALLLSSFGKKRSRPGSLAVSTFAIAGIAVADVVTAVQLGREGKRGNGHASLPDKASRVTKTVTIRRPPEEVYRFFRSLDNLARVMKNVDGVQSIDGISHWKVRGPVGKRLEWDAEIVEDVPNERIAWRALEGASVPHRGSIRFSEAPKDFGTEVVFELVYDPPLHRLGDAVAKAFGMGVASQIDADLLRMKQVLETGEIVQSDASIHKGPHPARPSYPDSLAASR